LFNGYGGISVAEDDDGLHTMESKNERENEGREEHIADASS
jgi:hypothetical protein